jgi:hypothetical protein
VELDLRSLQVVRGGLNTHEAIRKDLDRVSLARRSSRALQSEQKLLRPALWSARFDDFVDGQGRLNILERTCDLFGCSRDWLFWRHSYRLALQLLGRASILLGREIELCPYRTTRSGDGELFIEEW